MENLRIVDFVVSDSTNIIVTFTDNLDLSIGISNVTITAPSNVPNIIIRSVTVRNATLLITTTPFTPLAQYKISFNSSNIQFKDITNTKFLFEDGITNTRTFYGLVNESIIESYLKRYFTNNVYNTEEGLISDYLKGFGKIASKALYDIRQTKNEGYISNTIVDEPKIRGNSAFDRLNEEAAYKVLRVGKRQTTSPNSYSLNIFTEQNIPISLKTKTNTEILTVNNNTNIGTFNSNLLILNLTKPIVTRATSITFTYTDRAPFTYPLDTYGYYLKESKYDPTISFSYATLTDTQIRLTEKVLSDANFSLINIFSVVVNYEYKNLGTIIDPTTLDISTTDLSSRETLPPLLTVVNLKGKQIVKSNGDTGTIGDIVFVDPNTLQELVAHPAFKYEIKFGYDNLPSRIGEYSVDYSTGTIYIYGSDTSNTGTGAQPPLATYYYKTSYTLGIDYVYDTESGDLIPLPLGNILNKNIIISFLGEETLVEGIDYISSAHVEVLDERINNNLLAKNVIRVNNYPITDVFKVKNETTGENYQLVRWSDDKVYFSYNNEPNILSTTFERVSFDKVSNETLIVSEILNTLNPGEKIYKFNLPYPITSGSEDCFGSINNSNVIFSDMDHFVNEKYYSPYRSETLNLNSLTSLGDYSINYRSGVVYCRVTTDTFFDLGGISYTSNKIKTSNNHITSVEDIFYQISLSSPKNKIFSYNTVTDNTVSIDSLDDSDEQYLNNDTAYPYLVHTNQIGVFNALTFVPGVTNSIKNIRGIYEIEDLINNSTPINFNQNATFTSNVIDVNNYIYSGYLEVKYDTNYYIDVPIALNYISSNITYTYSVVRQSDLVQLWDISGTLVLGDILRLDLSGVGSPVVDDAVEVVITLTINDLATVSVDYNKGDMYIDYTYLADEILVSYEYGDNSLDFRSSTTLAPGETYYATYKTGALRGSLLANFGSLINIDLLNDLPTDFNRESYRDCIIAALQAFAAGPTLTSIKDVVNNIIKVQPEVIEYVFQNWSLGFSYLNLEKPKQFGNIELLPGKFDNGALLKDGYVTVPVSSDLKLESGSLETWIIPQWDGIDNDAILTIQIKKDNVIFDNRFVFIGADEAVVKYDDLNNIVINKNIKPGMPNINKNGVFIYYAKDQVFGYYRWFIDIVDDLSPSVYLLTVQTDGKFYNMQDVYSDASASITSGDNKLTYKISNFTNDYYELSFVADRDHYLVDFGTTSRFSIYKDTSGYFNFKIKDKNNTYLISSNVSSWKKDEQHHIAASWKIGTNANLDQMHLFLDGQECYNLVKYSDKQFPYANQIYRTISQEEFVGIANKSIYYFDDLTTTIGSNIVTSTQNFGTLDVNIGDTVLINEPTFSLYTIVNISGQNLTLSSTMPASITNGKFIINQQVIPVNTNVDYKKFSISTISSYFTNTDLVTNITSNVVTGSSSFTNTVIGDLIRIVSVGYENYYTVIGVSGNTLYLSADMPATNTGLTYFLYHNTPLEIPGIIATTPSYSKSKILDQNYLTLNNKIAANDILILRTLGINSKLVKHKYYQWGDTSNILKTRISPPIDINDVKVTHILLDSTYIGPSNSVYTSYFTSNNILTDQPITSSTGRTLTVNITGDNIDFTLPVLVHVHGISSATPTIETLTFTAKESLDTLNLFSSIDYIVVEVTPLNALKDACVVTISEKYKVTTNEGSTVYPIMKFSYQMLSGSTLSSNGTNVLTDSLITFSNLYVGNYLYIPTPSVAAGYYLITAVSGNTITVSTNVIADTNITYKVLNVTDTNTGYQNGYLLFETYGLPGTVFNLNNGSYEIEYETFLNIDLDRNYRRSIYRS